MAQEQSRDPAEDYRRCTQRFIELANVMKGENLEPGLVSQALMSASSVYATYAVAGNEGGLTESGIEKLSSLSRASLEEVQKNKKTAAK